MPPGHWEKKVTAGSTNASPGSRRPNEPSTYTGVSSMLTIDPDDILHEEHATVLDIGCGSGRHLTAVLARPGARVIGLDLCRDDLKKAAERICIHEAFGWEVSGRWLLAQANGCFLPVATKAVDAVILSEVLEHVPDDAGLLQEVNRVLKPGGFLGVSVPRFFPEWICWRLSRAYRTTPGGHIRIYPRKRLLSLLRQAGFQPFGCSYAHSLHVPFWWLKCLVGIEKDNHPLVQIYNRFLTWDMMQKPRLTTWLERLLNPVLGKSLVVYCRK
uniref:Class I SAM-dependent methyltransferase n=1 Tax=Desulfatirhabdium butyrativorans TaxID=340467 RepID=A0A7C4MKI4_9BACT